MRDRPFKRFPPRPARNRSRVARLSTAYRRGTRREGGWGLRVKTSLHLVSFWWPQLDPPSHTHTQPLTQPPVTVQHSEIRFTPFLSPVKESDQGSQWNLLQKQQNNRETFPTPTDSSFFQKQKLASLSSHEENGQREQNHFHIAFGKDFLVPFSELQKRRFIHMRNFWPEVCASQHKVSPCSPWQNSTTLHGKIYKTLEWAVQPEYNVPRIYKNQMIVLGKIQLFCVEIQVKQLNFFSISQRIASTVSSARQEIPFSGWADQFQLKISEKFRIVLQVEPSKSPCCFKRFPNDSIWMVWMEHLVVGLGNTLVFQ